jgi:DNA-binding GntR family transcriptional regulator
VNVHFKPNRSNLGQQTFDYLLDKIYSIQIEPGSRLGVSEVADELEISRSPVRDAFHLLVAEGLLHYHPATGYHVIQLDEQYIRDLFGVRRALELESMRLCIPRLDDARIRDLQSTWAHLRRTDLDQLESHMEADNRLHNSFGQMSGNVILRDMLTKIISRAGFVRRWVYKHGMAATHLANIADEHLQILSAMLDKDVDRAVSLLDEHLHRGELIALSILAENHNT